MSRAREQAGKYVDAAVKQFCRWISPTLETVVSVTIASYQVSPKEFSAGCRGFLQLELCKLLAEEEKAVLMSMKLNNLFEFSY
ncbi:MAG: hypothetical protein V7K95_16995 [Nostoc sp.]